MEKLLWELFEMIRTLLPPTQENTKRLAEWAQRYHALEAPAARPAPELEEKPDEELDPDQEHELEELENEGGPVRSSRGTPPKRKKK